MHRQAIRFLSVVLLFGLLAWVEAQNFTTLIPPSTVAPHVAAFVVLTPLADPQPTADAPFLPAEDGNRTVMVFASGVGLRSDDAAERRVQLLLRNSAMVIPSGWASLDECVNTTASNFWAPSTRGAYNFATSDSSSVHPRVVTGVPPGPWSLTYAQQVDITFARLDEVTGGAYPGALAGPASTDLVVNVSIAPECLVPQVARLYPSTSFHVRFSPPSARRSISQAAVNGVSTAGLVLGILASFTHGYTVLALWPTFVGAAVISASSCTLRDVRQDAIATMDPAAGRVDLILSWMPYANEALGGKGSGGVTAGAVVGNALAGIGTALVAVAGMRLLGARPGWFISNVTAYFRMPSALLPIVAAASIGAFCNAVVVIQHQSTEPALVVAAVVPGVLLCTITAIPLVIGFRGRAGDIGGSSRWYWYCDTMSGDERVADRLRRDRLERCAAAGVPLLHLAAAPVVAKTGATVAKGVTFEHVQHVTDPSDSVALLLPDGDESEPNADADLLPNGGHSAGRHAAAGEQTTSQRHAVDADTTVATASDDDYDGGPVTANPVTTFFIGRGFWADHVFDFATAAGAARNRILTSRMKRPSQRRQLDAETAAAAAVAPGATPWRCGFTERNWYAVSGFGRPWHAQPWIVADPVLLLATVATVFAWRPPVAQCGRSGMLYIFVTLATIRALAVSVVRPYRTPHANTWAIAIAWACAFGACFATISGNVGSARYWAETMGSTCGAVAIGLGMAMNVALAVVSRGERARQRPMRRVVEASNDRFHDALWHAAKRRQAELAVAEANAHREREAQFELRRATRLAEEAAAREEEQAHRERLALLRSQEVIESLARNPLDAADRSLGLDPRRHPGGAGGVSLDDLRGRKLPARRQPITVSSLFDAADMASEDAAVFNTNPPETRRSDDRAAAEYRGRRPVDTTLEVWGLLPAAPPESVATAGPSAPPASALQTRREDHTITIATAHDGHRPALSAATAARPLPCGSQPQHGRPFPRTSAAATADLHAFDADFDAALKSAYHQL